jgi:serine/threonine protein kinase
MEVGVDNLCDLLKRSRLVRADEAESIYERFALEMKDKPASALQFARWLVQQNLLTEYQASLLAKGLVDDFFLGEYKILERVGRGRMAGVYKAERPCGGHVAIKVLPPSRMKIPAFFARFQREATLARTFDHPNVVRSLDVGESKGLHFLVMELLDGETVDDVLQRRKRLTPPEAVGIVHQALLGLQHLHEHGVVHRDLKPANLMLVPGASDTALGRSVKILDIGLARKILEELTTADRIESKVTQEGVLLGTPDYLSPEQARDPRAIDVRSDIYSLGCVLFHLITGRTPFPDGNVLNLMIRHATEPPRPLREFVPAVPDDLQRALDAMMAKQAEGRFPTPLAAAEALAPLLVELEAAERSPQDALETPLESMEDSTIEIMPVHPEAAPALPVPLSPPLLVPKELTKKASSDRIPAARALNKSAALPRPGPLTKPHAPLPDHIELVPIDASADPFAPRDADDDLIALPRRRKPEDWYIIAVAAGVLTLVVVIVLVVSLLNG